MQTKLASMLNRLELEISEVEKRIGDKMVRVACDSQISLKLVRGNKELWEEAWREESSCEDYEQGWKRGTLLSSSSDKVVP